MQAGCERRFADAQRAAGFAVGQANHVHRDHCVSEDGWRARYRPHDLVCAYIVLVGGWHVVFKQLARGWSAR